MLSYKAREYYEFINVKLNEFQPNLEIILEFGKSYKENTTACLKKVLNTKNTNSGGNITYYGVDGGKIVESFRNVINDFKSKFNFFEVFGNYSILKSTITNYLKDNLIKDNSIITFFDNIDTFFKLYQKFMQSNNDIELALDFGQCVNEIVSSYLTLRESYEVAEINLLDNVETEYQNDDLQRITIQLLGIEYSFKDFTTKLNIIDKIYNDIGMIIYEKGSYEKLKIIKIESGSLLSIILGDKNIIEAISILMNKSVSLVFNKFTYEGKIYRHNEFKNELISDIEITEKMKSLGYDVSSAEQNNNEALTMLTKDLLEISNSSPKIRINDNEYSIKEEIKTTFLKENKILTLDSAEKENES